jgi:hypothetical protein
MSRCGSTWSSGQGNLINKKLTSFLKKCRCEGYKMCDKLWISNNYRRLYSQNRSHKACWCCWNWLYIRHVCQWKMLKDYCQNLVGSWAGCKSCARIYVQSLRIQCEVGTWNLPLFFILPCVQMICDGLVLFHLDLLVYFVFSTVLVLSFFSNPSLLLRNLVPNNPQT